MNAARSTAEIDRLTLEIVERLRSSCLHLCEAELVLLATSIATLELKYQGYASTTLGERKHPPSVT